MPRFTDLTPEEQQDMRQQVLSAIAAEDNRAPLTIADIRKMTPEQIITRQDAVDQFMKAWDGTEPEAEGDQAKHEPTPLEKYKAELDVLPEAEARRRAGADWASGKLAKLMRGENA